MKCSHKLAVVKSGYQTGKQAAEPSAEPTALRTVLGWFSVGLGALEFVLPRRINRVAGLARALPLLRLLGLRKMANGCAVLNKPSHSGPSWARVAGDAIDFAVLVKGLNRQNPQRIRTVLSCAALLGLTAIDILSALTEESRKL